MPWRRPDLLDEPHTPGCFRFLAKVDRVGAPRRHPVPSGSWWCSHCVEQRVAGICWHIERALEAADPPLWHGTLPQVDTVARQARRLAARGLPVGRLVVTRDSDFLVVSTHDLSGRRTTPLRPAEPDIVLTWLAAQLRRSRPELLPEETLWASMCRVRRIAWGGTWRRPANREISGDDSDRDAWIGVVQQERFDSAVEHSGYRLDIPSPDGMSTVHQNISERYERLKAWDTDRTPGEDELHFS